MMKQRAIHLMSLFFIIIVRPGDAAAARPAGLCSSLAWGYRENAPGQNMDTETWRETAAAERTASKPYSRRHPWPNRRRAKGNLVSSLREGKRGSRPETVAAIRRRSP